MEPLRIGIIGAGQMGAHFAALASQHPICQLAGVADVMQERAQAAGQRYGVPFFNDHRALLAQAGLDAVVIATSEAFHLAPVLDAARQGKHILVEKPLAATSAEGEQMVAAAAQAGVLLMTAHVVRFDPNYGQAARVVRSGSLGEVVHVNARRNTSVGDARRLGGRVSITFYLGSHSVDALQWIMGCPIVQVTSIAARKAMADLGTDDTVISLLRFANGAIGSLENSWIRPNGAATRKIGSSLVVMGTEGAFAVETMAPGAVRYGTGLAEPFNPGYSFDDAEFGFVSNCYRDEFAHFVACIRQGQRPLVTPEQALSAVRVCEAIEESLRSGRTVDIVQSNIFA